MEPPLDGSDEDLARSAAAGSRPAFEQLVIRFGGSIQRLFEARVADPHRALDLSQEVWVKVFRGLAGFRPDSNFRSWLFAIALNTVRDDARKRRRSPDETQSSQVATLAEAAPPTEEPSDGATSSAVDAALACVSEPYRTALILVDREGFSYEDAARSLQCAAGTVKSRVSRGRRTFREHWLGASSAVRSGPPRGTS